MKCLVTGANGFIGRDLCRHLDSKGVAFVGTARTQKLLPGGQSSVPVNLMTDSVPSALLQNVDVVFHLAGIAHQRAESLAYEQVNYRATAALAADAAAAGVKLFVFMSSVKAMGPSGAARARTEREGVEPADPYGASKYHAEEVLRETCTSEGMSVVILRPALVYGAGARGNLAFMARAVRFGAPRPPAVGGRSMIARQDLVELLYQLAVTPPAGCHTWIVSDGEVYTARQIHDLMRSALGKSPARLSLPEPAWRLACRLVDIATSGKKGDTFERVFGTELYCSAALRRDLAWHSHTTLADEIPGMISRVDSPGDLES